MQNVKRARACKDVPFDVVMLTTLNINADENFENLKKVIPVAKRVDGVKGIPNAHKQAAMLADTSMVYVVDGDAHNLLLILNLIRYPMFGKMILYMFGVARICKWIDIRIWRCKTISLHNRFERCN